MPVKKWFKYFETLDEKYLSVNGIYLDGVDYKGGLKILQADFIKLFGFNEEYISMLHDRALLLNAEINLLVTGNLQYKNEIKRIKSNLSTTSKKEVENYTNFIIAIESALGREIDEDKVSVKKFYTYCQNIEKGAKEQELRNIKNKLHE